VGTIQNYFKPHQALNSNISFIRAFVVILSLGLSRFTRNAPILMEHNPVAPFRLCLVHCIVGEGDSRFQIIDGRCRGDAKAGCNGYQLFVNDTRSFPECCTGFKGGPNREAGLAMYR